MWMYLTGAHTLSIFRSHAHVSRQSSLWRACLRRLSVLPKTARQCLQSFLHTVVLPLVCQQPLHTSNTKQKYTPLNLVNSKYGKELSHPFSICERTLSIPLIDKRYCSTSSCTLFFVGSDGMSETGKLCYTYFQTKMIVLLMMAQFSYDWSVEIIWLSSIVSDMLDISYELEIEVKSHPVLLKVATFDKSYMISCQSNMAVLACYSY